MTTILVIVIPKILAGFSHVPSFCGWFPQFWGGQTPNFSGDPMVSEQVLQAPCMSRSYDGRHAMAMQAMPPGAG